MAVGRNSRTLLGLQSDMATKATELKVLKATSNSMEVNTENQESEALTGNRFIEDEMQVSETAGGDVGLEYTLDTLPEILKLAGLTEDNAPSNFSTTLASDASSGSDIIKPEKVYGIFEGDSIEVTDGTNTDTATVQSVDFRTKEVTLDTTLANAYVAGNTVTNTTKYKHIFTPDQNITAWGTLIKDISDANYYEEYIGCRVDTLNFEISKQSYVSGDVSFLGILGEELNADVDGTIASKYTVSELTSQLMRSFGTDIFVDGSSLNSILNDFSTSISNNIKTDDFDFNDKTRRSLEAQASEISVDLGAKFKKQEYMDIKQLEKDNMYTTIDCYLNEGLGLEYPRVKITEATNPVDGADEITSSFTASILNDSVAGTPIKVIVVDDQSTVY